MRKRFSWRIWLLIIALLFSVLAIRPSLEKGVIIKSVDRNSTAFEQGLRNGLIIKAINNQEIKNIADYSSAIEKLFENININDTKDEIAELKKEPTEINQTNQINTINKTNITNQINTINKTNITNKTETNLTETNQQKKTNEGKRIKLIITTKAQEFILFVDKPPEITVANLPASRIKTGLDLAGGARALIQPEKSLSATEIQDLIAITTNRLNVYGISDISLRSVSDLAGERYMLIEVAGATPTDLKDLIAKQGKFEARIGNETAFIGGKKDITSICRNDASCAGIESCFPVRDGYTCRFRFVVYLSEEAAKRHANITASLGTNITEFGRYLDRKLDLYVDDNLVDSLLISEDLKGRVTTQIQVQGSGSGKTQEDAFNSAKESMQKLQTILITGSLPYKLEIVKLDTISPLLGKKFVSYIFLAALAAIFSVAIIVLFRYRRIKISLAVLLTSFSEIIIILGLAAFIKWNLDLPSIAGILIVIGTGVDQQIIMVDESRSSQRLGIIEKLKRALFIIIGAYFTSLAALIPLYWAGAGLLRGFAVTTIMGITIAVLITRPAFAEILKRIEA